MNETFEKSSAMMEEAWESWKKMCATHPLWPKDANSTTGFNIEPWIATWRSASDFNQRSWKTVRENAEAAMLKIMKESQFYSQAQEAQVKEAWSHFNQSAEALEHHMEDIFSRWEDMISPKTDQQ